MENTWFVIITVSPGALKMLMQRLILDDQSFHSALPRLSCFSLQMRNKRFSIKSFESSTSSWTLFHKAFKLAIKLSNEWKNRFLCKMKLEAFRCFKMKIMFQIHWSERYYAECFHLLSNFHEDRMANFQIFV